MQPVAGRSSRPVSPNTVLVLCFLVAVLEGYDLQVISSVGPGLRMAMQLSPEQMGWFFSASLIGLAIGAIVGGALADRFGRKAVLLWSVALLGVFTFASALAPDYSSLLTIRILAGLGLGGAMPTLIALVAEVSGGAKTTSYVTTMICGQPLGGVISALAGRAFAESYGWQSLFVVGGILTVLIIPLLMRWLPETGRSESSPERMAILPALFAEGRWAGTLLLWVIFILTLALLSISLSWTPLLVMGKGFERLVGLNAIIAINIGGIIGGLVVSRVIDRVGAAWPMLGLYGLVAASLFLFANIDHEIGLMFAAVLVGVGVLGAQFCMYGLAPQIYPISGRGVGVGVAVAMGRIGSVTGPIAIGRLIGAGASENQAILAITPVALGAAISLLALTFVTGGALRSAKAQWRSAKAGGSQGVSPQS